MLLAEVVEVPEVAGTAEVVDAEGARDREVVRRGATALRTAGAAEQEALLVDRLPGGGPGAAGAGPRLWTMLVLERLFE